MGTARKRAALDGRELEFGVEDAIRGMNVLDAVFASERSDTWASVAS